MGTNVNNLVNLARDWGQKIHPETDKSQGLLTRLVAPRVAMIGVTVCDVSQIAKNILHAAIQLPGVAVKWVVKPFSCISGSEALKNFENRFPGISDLLKTVARIVKYALGAAVAGTFGLLCPSAGIKFHDVMGLSRDKRAEALLAETKDLVLPCCVKTEEPEALVVELVQTNVVAQEEEKASDQLEAETVAVIVAEAAAEEPAPVVTQKTAETVVETGTEQLADEVVEESIVHFSSSSEEEEASVKEETSVAAKTYNAAWNAAGLILSTGLSTGQKAIDAGKSTRLFKWASGNEV